MTFVIALILASSVLVLAPAALAYRTGRSAGAEVPRFVSRQVGVDRPLPGVQAAADLWFGPYFLDCCRYASLILVVGVDPDRPDDARVSPFTKDYETTVHELLDPAEVARLLRIHADVVEEKDDVL